MGKRRQRERDAHPNAIGSGVPGSWKEGRATGQGQCQRISLCVFGRRCQVTGAEFFGLLAAIYLSPRLSPSMGVEIGLACTVIQLVVASAGK